MFRLVFARSALAETALRSMASLPAIAQIGKCRYMGQPSQGVADDGPFFECPGAVSFFRQVLSGIAALSIVMVTVVLARIATSADSPGGPRNQNSRTDYL